jgi:hypothetical protein
MTLSGTNYDDAIEHLQSLELEDAIAGTEADQFADRVRRYLRAPFEKAWLAKLGGDEGLAGTLPPGEIGI